jgi:hypothetical protein
VCESGFIIYVFPEGSGFWIRIQNMLLPLLAKIKNLQIRIQVAQMNIYGSAFAALLANKPLTFFVIIIIWTL